MASGDGFSADARRDIDRAIRNAETICRYEFSVFVGRVDGDPRQYAGRLHAALASPARSVLLLVDPAARVMRVVTGADVRRDLSDEAVRLAVVSMESAFAQDDLVGGIERGLIMLAESARRPQTLHSD